MFELAIIAIGSSAALAFFAAGLLTARHAERNRRHGTLDLIGRRPRSVGVSDSRKNAREVR